MNSFIFTQSKDNLLLMPIAVKKLLTNSIPLLMAALMLPVFTGSAMAQRYADTYSTVYKTPDGILYSRWGDGFCRWIDLAAVERAMIDPGYQHSYGVMKIAYDSLVGRPLRGYCNDDTGPTLPKVVIDPRRSALGDVSCRYFVATDRFTSKTHDGAFGGISVWIIDENRYSGMADAYRWRDRFVAVTQLQSDVDQPRRSVPARSEWFELSPKGKLPSQFSFYAFTWWKSYLLSKFKVKDINPLEIDRWHPTRIIAGFRGEQTIATRSVRANDYVLDFEVLRLCAKEYEVLNPEDELSIPQRKN